MAKKKNKNLGHNKGKVMITPEELEELKKSQLKNATLKQVYDRMDELMVRPFDDMLDQLEAKHQRVKDLKEELEELTGNRKCRA